MPATRAAPSRGRGIGGGLANVAGATATAQQQHDRLTTRPSAARERPAAMAPMGSVAASANILGSTLTVSNCTLDHNQAVGGEGGWRQRRQRPGRRHLQRWQHRLRRQFPDRHRQHDHPQPCHRRRRRRRRQRRPRHRRRPLPGCGRHRVLGRLHRVSCQAQPRVDQQRRRVRGLRNLLASRRSAGAA